jgi:hypothetical protein
VTADIPNNLIEIQDPDIDVDEIMAQIRARVQQRRAELGYDKRTFPAFDLAAYPGEPEDIAYDVNLYHYLRLVNTTYNQVETGLNLAPSPATQLPIIGPLWARVRGQVHNLVLFYVNRSLAHQTNVNRHLISVLNRLTLLSQEQQRIIAILQAEVDALRRRLDAEP